MMLYIWWEFGGKTKWYKTQDTQYDSIHSKCGRLLNIKSCLWGQELRRDIQYTDLEITQVVKTPDMNEIT